ncbi:MAG TPA: PHP domain-containing protein [Chroococcidiopsis sp.]
MLELHCHTTHSDGTLTPQALVDHAIAAGVTVLAITDHDTVSGWDEAIAAVGDRSLEIVPGLELSTIHNGRSMHILGFYPDRQQLEPPLRDRLLERHHRAAKMIAKLAELGFAIELPPTADNTAPGRPHIAAAMVSAGYAQSIQEVFDRWLGEYKPAYVEYDSFSATEGIQLLRRCGAVPVWAHPYLFRGGPVESVLPELVNAGLMGVEVYHPSHSASQSRILEELCEQYGLLKTGGSDYHGPAPVGNGSNATTLNQLKLTDRLLIPLKRAAAELRSPAKVHPARA